MRASSDTTTTAMASVAVIVGLIVINSAKLPADCNREHVLPLNFMYIYISDDW